MLEHVSRAAPLAKPVLVVGDMAYVSGHGPLKPDGTMMLFGGQIVNGSQLSSETYTFGEPAAQGPVQGARLPDHEGHEEDGEDNAAGEHVWQPGTYELVVGSASPGPRAIALGAPPPATTRVEFV